MRALGRDDRECYSFLVVDCFSAALLAATIGECAPPPPPPPTHPPTRKHPFEKEEEVRLNSPTRSRPTTHHNPQVCETSPNVVDVKIGKGYVSDIKVILSKPNATVGGLEFVVTAGKKSTSTFCGRALGLSAWIGKPGKAVGAIGGTCSAPVTATRRRGRSMLEEAAAKPQQQPGVEAPVARASTSPAEAAATPAPSMSALSLPPAPPLLPPSQLHADEEHHARPQQPQIPRRAHAHHDEDAAAAPAPALAAAAPAAAGVAPPSSLSRRRLAQVPNNGTTTGGLSAGTLQVVLVPAPQGENNSGAYGNGAIFGG